MKCLATTKHQNLLKIKHRSVDDALEMVLIVLSYVLLECFKYGQDKVAKIHEKIEWYANICLDEDEEMVLDTYSDILYEDYNYSLNFKKRNLDGLSKAERIQVSSQDSAIIFILTIVAYLFFDKFGLNKNRVETIFDRIMFYVNEIRKDSTKLYELQAVLKEKHDFTISFNGG